MLSAPEVDASTDEPKGKIEVGEAEAADEVPSETPEEVVEPVGSMTVLGVDHGSVTD